MPNLYFTAEDKQGDIFMGEFATWPTFRTSPPGFLRPSRPAPRTQVVL